MQTVLVRSLAGSPTKQRFFSSNLENAPPLKSPRMKDGKLQNYQQEIVVSKGSKLPGTTKRKPLSARKPNMSKSRTPKASTPRDARLEVSKIPVFSPSRPVLPAKKSKPFEDPDPNPGLKQAKRSKSGIEDSCASCFKLHSEMINAQEVTFCQR